MLSKRTHQACLHLTSQLPTLHGELSTASLFFSPGVENRKIQEGPRAVCHLDITTALMHVKPQHRAHFPQWVHAQCALAGTAIYECFSAKPSYTTERKFETMSETMKNFMCIKYFWIKLICCRASRLKVNVKICLRSGVTLCLQCELYSFQISESSLLQLH